MKVYAVGVGPGSPAALTEQAKRVIAGCDVVVGYEYTMQTIRHLLAGKKTIKITMSNQEEVYQSIKNAPHRALAVPFTGDASFSESEVVDRLIEIFGDVDIIPGISSIQAAAAKTRVPLDRARVITMHITGPIERQKIELVKAVIDGFSVILVPRPWPSDAKRNFMPSEVAALLRRTGVETDRVNATVFESLTLDERRFDGAVSELVGREFSPMSVLVIRQTKPDSYMNYRWQWDQESARNGAPASSSM